MKQHFAPAGTPVKQWEILAGIASSFGPRKPSAALADELRQIADAQRCFLISSGRAAMTMLMSAVKDVGATEGRDQVIVPGYTCYSVPASIARSGLKVRLCDVDPATLSMDLDALDRFDFARVAAIVTANLYGLPNDLRQLEVFARDKSVLLIDDAAQALGAQIGSRAVGGFGAAGIYSFDKGKNITTIQGGAAVISHSSLLARFEEKYAELHAASAAATMLLVAKLSLYSVGLRPWIYEYVQRIGALGLGQTVYEDDFPVRMLPEALSGIGLRLLDRLDALTAARAANAVRIRDALSDVSGVGFPRLLPDAHPVYARFPVFVDDVSRRADLIDNLRAGGIGASGSYPHALCDVPEVVAIIPSSDRDLPGARQVSRSVVTLPTHPYCPAHLADDVARIVRTSLGSSGTV